MTQNPLNFPFIITINFHWRRLLLQTIIPEFPQKDNMKGRVQVLHSTTSTQVLMVGCWSHSGYYPKWSNVMVLEFLG